MSRLEWASWSGRSKTKQSKIKQAMSFYRLTVMGIEIKNHVTYLQKPLAPICMHLTNPRRELHAHLVRGGGLRCLFSFTVQVKALPALRPLLPPSAAIPLWAAAVSIPSAASTIRNFALVRVWWRGSEEGWRKKTNKQKNQKQTRPIQIYRHKGINIAALLKGNS